VSREANVEIVRRSFEHFETMDVERWVADWDEDIVFDVSGYAPFTGEPKTYRGQLAILEFFGGMMAGTRVLRVHVDRVEALDGERVIALYAERRQDAEAPEPHEVEVGIIYTLRDGRMTHVRVFSDQAAALAAAGA
jgi:ketosteroid isomerase-like protein